MGLGNDLLHVGLSGLLSSQRALTTTAHNITNSNTAGYSRQQVELQARLPQWSGGVYVGNGVDVTEITRSYDRFLTREVQVSTSTAAEYRTKHRLATELDSLLGTPETGLSEPLQAFFDALEAVSTDPSSLPARQLVLDQGEQLANRFQSIDGSLELLGEGIESQVRVATDEINSLAASIADLNVEIVASEAKGGQPNDLLDLRDELLRRLSERVSTTTHARADGALNVSIGTGQPLVVGSESRELLVAAREEDPTGVGILIRHPNAASVEVTSQIRGGTLGALLDLDQGMLDDAQRRLGEIALGLAEQVNAQHQLGMDLRGNLGGLFFSDINAPELQAARATGYTSNTGTASLQVIVDSVGNLKNSDYRLSYDGTEYRLVRESDDELIGTYATLPQTIASEGFTIQIDDASAVAEGDRFTLRPSASALHLLDVVVPDNRSLALAAPVRSAISPGNLGDAAIGPAAVSNLAGAPLADPITLTYSSAANELLVSAPLGGTLPYDPSTDSGESLTLNVPSFGDISFSLTGIPADGDSFRIEHNAGGTSDNSNALLISDLQALRVLCGGSATFAEGYSSTVSDVAIRTSALERTSTTQTELLRRAEDARSEYSGVNLDEEAANLMCFQQAYQASARVVAVADEVFQTLLRACGG
jgi:flagellar hook-associated protein 1 FlgK